MAELVYLMAAEAEYGPRLKAMIDPVITGVGPVEAAIAATRVLADRAAAGRLPDYVVSLGSAGSATLEHLAVYQAVSVSYRDMDASAIGFEKGRTPFLDLPRELRLDPRISDLPGARLSTGANVVSGAAYRNIDADMVDMESFAVLRACQSFGVPLIVLRGISDGVSELETFADWADNLAVIDEKLARALDIVHAHL